MTPAKPRPPRTAQPRYFTFGRVTLAFVLIVALIIAAATFAPTTRWAHGTGYAITAQNAELYPLVPGHVHAILVNSGDRVTQGQPLIQLNDDLPRAALDAAEATGDNDAHLASLRIELSQRTITAPIDGVVYLHRFDVGEYVTPDRALGQVFDPAQWIVRIQLNERMLPHVEQGQTARVFLAAHHQFGSSPMPGTVARIDPVVTPRATGNGVFTVDLAIDPPPDLLLEPGMTAWARIDTGQTTWLRRLLNL